MSEEKKDYLQLLAYAARDARALPVPEADAMAHSQRLIDLLQQEISDAGGRISFRRYMELVLYAPGLGYYAAGSHKLGAAGDFITAPELSPLFSQCIAAAIQPVLQLQDEMVIVEVGAGSGCMAADILQYLEAQQALPEAYWILELSADLRQRQLQTLQQRLPHLLERVQWLQSLPPSFSGVVVANELLDAMPVQLFQKQGDQLAELLVSTDDDQFGFVSEPVSDARLQRRLQQIETETQSAFADGYYSEVNFAAEDWVCSMAERLEQGLLLLIDYGFPRHEYYHPQRQQGTLMCHYRHRAHADPFVYPGLQDITAHVDFTALADAAIACGLQLLGYTSQANFLMGAGLLELAQQPQVNVQQQLELASQIKKLTLPHEMGELFKVMGLGKNLQFELPAFRFNDQREHL